jgi:outer membrane immunogenic protein
MFDHLLRGAIMKKQVLGTVAALALGLGASAAVAADMPVKAPPPPVAIYTWTGCYIGLSIGDSWGRGQHTAVAGTTAVRGGVPVALAAGTSIADSFSLSGFLGGAQGGCNYQVGGWVFGVEADWSVTNKEGQSFENRNFPLWIASTKERWLGTARLRLGYAITDKWLWYVTGGGAWSKFDTSSMLVPNPVVAFTQTDWRGGWTVGAGTEYALGYGWSIKSEFLYVDFGTHTTFTGGPIPVNVFAPREVKVHDYIFRFGMNYKFGWGVGKSPVVASY